MAWVTLGLQLLKVVQAIFGWAQKQGHINEGKRQQIAKETAAVAEAAKAAEETRAAVDAMSDEEIDDILAE